MSAELYRYKLNKDVSLEDIESTLLLALMATENLHGQAEVRLDAAHFLNKDRRACVIDASTEVGRDINRLFVGFAAREFGDSVGKPYLWWADPTTILGAFKYPAPLRRRMCRHQPGFLSGRTQLPAVGYPSHAF